MSLVVDASVAVKWVVLEEGRGEALRRTAGLELAGPDLVLVEAANILWKKVRRNQLDREQASRGLKFIAGAYQTLIPSIELVDEALSLSFRLDHPAYDCMYLACSRKLGAPLLTADRQLAALGGTPELPVELLAGGQP